MEWSLKRSFSFISFSFLFTLFLSVSSFCLYKKNRQKKIADPKYVITYICQTGPEKEALKTDYLAELLSLNQKNKISLYAFDVELGEKKLLATPLIKRAKIKKVFPNTLYIDYEVRRPVAKLADYENTLIDQEGYLFPMAPFFSPKEIPEFYLGLPPFGQGVDNMGRKGGEWLKPLKNDFLSLCFHILSIVSELPRKEGMRVKRIDVSNSLAPTLGQREIVIATEEEILLSEGKVATFPKLLRLSAKDYSSQLSSFFLLRRHMETDYRRQLVNCTHSVHFTPRIVDLRIPHLAFVENQ